MKLDWIDEFYADHEDGWCWTSTDYQRYGLSEDEIFIADWLVSSVSAKYAVEELLLLISNSEAGIDGKWKSNDHAYFQSNQVILEVGHYPFEQRSFASHQIKQIVECWGAIMQKYDWFNNDGYSKE